MVTEISAGAGLEVQGRSFGGHSLTGRLRAVIVRRPAPSSLTGDRTSYGYVHPIDHSRAVEEHSGFVNILRENVGEVIVEGPDDAGCLDAIFSYDPSIITDQGAVLLRPGKDLRLPEVEFHRSTYQKLGIPIIGAIEAPGSVEGGDTLWLDETTLAVGHSYRTNREGLEQLAAILGGIGVSVLPFDLSHWHGPGECLHLMSFISPLATRTALAFLPLMPVSLVRELNQRQWKLIELPGEEFDSMGCNVLSLAPGKCLMLQGNPETRRRLEANGCEVLVYQGSEISLNRAGGPTCLTRPIWREGTGGA